MKNTSYELKNLVSKKRQVKRFRSLVCVLSVAVLFITSFSLTKQGITLSAELICEHEEHTHAGECYELTNVLTCEENHEHTEECFSEELTLTCNKEEHVHLDGCYKAENTEEDHQVVEVVAEIAPETTTVEEVKEEAPVAEINQEETTVEEVVEETTETTTEEVVEEITTEETAEEVKEEAPVVEETVEEVKEEVVEEEPTEETVEEIIEEEPTTEEETEENVEEEIVVEHKLENRNMTATIYTSSDYATVDETDSTIIHIEGKLPVDEETNEVVVKAVAYATNKDLIEVKEGEEVLLSYDITLLYIDDESKKFQPEEALKVSFESPILNEIENDAVNRLSVVYVPEDTQAEVEVVAEQTANQLEVSSDGESGTVTFEAEHFSEYALVSTPTEEIEVESWEQFKNAVATGRNLKIKFKYDMSADAPVHIKPNQTIVIDGNGKTVYRNPSETFYDGGYITADAGSNLVIDNTHFSGKAYGGAGFAWTTGNTNLNYNGVTQGVFVGFSGNALEIRNSTFKDINNGAGDNNGSNITNTAPIVVNSGTVQIDNSTISNNYFRPSNTTSPSVKGFTNTYNKLKNQSYSDRVNNSNDSQYSGDSQNTADGYYGRDPKKTAGALLVNGGTVTLNNGTKFNQNLGSVGAVTINGGNLVQNDGTEINQNKGFHAGAVSIVKGNYDLNGGTLNNNEGVWFGTVNVSSNAASLNMGTTGGTPVISHNTSLHKGGAIYVNSDNANLVGGDLHHNNAYVFGGAIYIEHDRTTKIQDAQIYHNSAYVNNNNFAGHYNGRGGGYWGCPTGNVDFNGSNVVIADNSANRTTDGGAGQDFFQTYADKLSSFKSGGYMWYNENTGKGWQSDSAIESIDSGTIAIQNFYSKEYPEGSRNDWHKQTGFQWGTTQFGAKLFVHDNSSPNGGGIASNGYLGLTNEKIIQTRINFVKQYEQGATKKNVKIVVELRDENNRIIQFDGRDQKNLYIHRNSDPMTVSLSLPSVLASETEGVDAYTALNSMTSFQNGQETQIGRWKITITEYITDTDPEVVNGEYKWDSFVSADDDGQNSHAYQEYINDWRRASNEYSVSLNNAQYSEVDNELKKVTVLQSTVHNTDKSRKLTINKVDENGNPVTGVNFSLWLFDGTKVQNALTEKGNGIYELNTNSLTNTDSGWNYYIAETTPNGYQDLGTVIPFNIIDDKFVIKMDGRSHAKYNTTTDQFINDKDRQTEIHRLNYGLIGTTDDKQVKYDVDSNGNIACRIINKAIDDVITINKVDEQGNPLSNVEFTVWRFDGTAYPNVIENKGNGVYQLKASSFAHEYNRGFNYYIAETTPSGYQELGTVIPFKINSTTHKFERLDGFFNDKYNQSAGHFNDRPNHKLDYSLIGTTDDHQIKFSTQDGKITYRVKNIKEDSVITINKVDEQGNPINGVQFKVVRFNNAFELAMEEKGNGVYQIKASSLQSDEGNYYIVETTPAGYEALGTVIPFKKTADNKFEKLDNATENGWYDKTNNCFGGRPTHKLDYSLIGTTDSYQIKVDAENGNITYRVINKKPLPTLWIQKTNKDGSKNLSGAVFELRPVDDNGRPREGTTYNFIQETINGQPNVGVYVIEDKDEGIKPGKYQLHETKAPEGYYLLGENEYIEVEVFYNTTTARYEIRADGSKVTENKASITQIGAYNGTVYPTTKTDIGVTVKNIEITYELPSTGGQGTWTCTIIGSLMILIGALLLGKKYLSGVVISR